MAQPSQIRGPVGLGPQSRGGRGEPLLDVWQALGKGSNNVGELWAAGMAARALLARPRLLAKPSGIVFLIDSKLIVGGKRGVSAPFPPAAPRLRQGAAGAVACGGESAGDLDSGARGHSGQRARGRAPQARCPDGTCRWEGLAGCADRAAGPVT